MIVMRLGRIGQETRRRFVLRSGFVSATESLEQASVIEMILARVRLKTQRLFHVRGGSVIFRLRRQNNSKVHMRFGVSRFEAQRSFVLFFRALPLAFFLQRQAIIKMLLCANWHIL